MNARTLDSIVSDLLMENRRIKLIKIDVEGSEFHVLKGMTETLKRTDRMVVEVWEQNFRQVTSFLKDKWFKVHVISHIKIPNLTFYYILAKNDYKMSNSP